jgi:hypothetical protein
MCDRSACLDRCWFTALDRAEVGDRQTRTRTELAERPSTSAPLVADLLTDVTDDSRNVQSE